MQHVESVAPITVVDAMRQTITNSERASASASEGAASAPRPLELAPTPAAPSAPSPRSAGHVAPTVLQGQHHNPGARLGAAAGTAPPLRAPPRTPPHATPGALHQRQGMSVRTPNAPAPTPIPPGAPCAHTHPR